MSFYVDVDRRWPRYFGVPPRGDSFAPRSFFGQMTYAVPGAGLGQDMPTLDMGTPAGGGGGAGESVSTDQASSFMSLWSRFSAIWQDFVGMKAEISDHQSQWDTLRAGTADPDLMDTADTQLAALDRAGQDRDQAEQAVNKYRGAWETTKSYLATAGRWFGLGQPYVHQGLGLVPLILGGITIVAAISALSYVVSTHQKLRAQLDYDGQLLEAVKAGKLTAQQAKDLAKHAPGRPGAGDDWWTKLFGTGTPWMLLVLGVGGLAAWAAWNKPGGR